MACPASHDRLQRPDPRDPEGPAAPRVAGGAGSHRHHDHGADRRDLGRQFRQPGTGLSFAGLGPPFDHRGHGRRPAVRCAGDDRPRAGRGPARRGRSGVAARAGLFSSTRRGGLYRPDLHRPLGPGPDESGGGAGGRGRAGADRAGAFDARLSGFGGGPVLPGGPGQAQARHGCHVGRQRGEPGAEPPAGSGPAGDRAGWSDRLLLGDVLRACGPGDLPFDLHRPPARGAGAGRVQAAPARPGRGA